MEVRTCGTRADSQPSGTIMTNPILALDYCTRCLRDLGGYSCFETCRTIPDAACSKVAKYCKRDSLVTNVEEQKKTVFLFMYRRHTMKIHEQSMQLGRLHTANIGLAIG